MPHTDTELSPIDAWLATPTRPMSARERAIVDAYEARERPQTWDDCPDTEGRVMNAYERQYYGD